MLPKVVDTIASSLNKGRIGLESATDVLSRIEYTKNQKTIMKASTALGTRLAVAWGEDDDTTGPQFNFKSCCNPSSTFHTSAKHSHLRSSAEIQKFLNQFLEEAQRRLAAIMQGARQRTDLSLLRPWGIQAREIKPSQGAHHPHRGKAHEDERLGWGPGAPLKGGVLGEGIKI